MTNSPDPQAELREKLDQLFGTRGMAQEQLKDEIMQLFNNLIAEIESKLPKLNPLKVTWKPQRDDVVMYGENQAIKEVKAILATYKGKEEG